MVAQIRCFLVLAGPCRTIVYHYCHVTIDPRILCRVSYVWKKRARGAGVSGEGGGGYSCHCHAWPSSEDHRPSHSHNGGTERVRRGGVFANGAKHVDWSLAPSASEASVTRSTSRRKKVGRILLRALVRSKSELPYVPCPLHI